MKNQKIKRLVKKLESEYSDVTLCLYDKDSGQFTMAGHCTTKGFLADMAIRCILIHSENEEVDPSVILMNIICSMADRGDIDRDKFKSLCSFFLTLDKAVKES
ncbi:hypothetical protein [Allisonella histaminiformans]|uniref:hypothetical protein n=1 Tax=Allisonella histaminiformans TaxID=209880 RepID=UPI00388F0176